MGKIDTGSKRIIHFYNQAWLEWTLQQSVTVEKELSSEFQFIARASDSLLQVKRGDEEFMTLTELQFQYKKEMPYRLMAYAALAREKYHKDVFVTVVYFLPPSPEVIIEKSFHKKFMGQVAHQDFKVICLWELDAKQVLAFNNPVLLPFIPLMQGGNTKPMVRECVTRIRQQEHAEDLEALLGVLASYVLDVNWIRQLLRWDMDIVQQSPIIQELVAKFREKDREEGRKEGSHQTLLQSLFQFLTIRFNATTEKFNDSLKQLDLKTLERLRDSAFASKTLAEFETLLAGILSQQSKKSDDK
jgi:predicted transposase YdaD